MDGRLKVTKQMPAATWKDKTRLQLTPAIQALQEGLNERFLSIILLGYHARVDAKEESDWDLLTIAKDLQQSHIERQRRMKTLLPPERRRVISILARTLEGFESALPSLFLEIALDGMILHDSKEYASSRLQRLIHDKDQRGEMCDKDFVWKLETFPGLCWSLACEEAI
jgi:predicted nucleotidyltransferase